MTYTMRYIRPETATDPHLLRIEHGGATWRLQLLHCATDEHRVRSSHVPHVHDVYHIVLFTRAENRFVLNDEQVLSRPGTLVLCPPGVPHDFAPLAAGPTTYDEVSFQFAAGQRLLSIGMNDLLSIIVQHAVAPLPLCRQLPPSGVKRLRPLIATVASEAAGDSPLALYRAHLALSELLAVLIEEIAGISAAAGDRLAIAHREITMHYAQPLSIISLAGDLELSPAYLCRAFKRRYGVSPIQFRQELRLGAAARLLETSSLSCKEIAARMGFADVQTFTKAFARHHGHTPGRFSRDLRGR